MLAFVDLWRAVEPQSFHMALEIGDGDEQVERVAARQQGRADWPRRHRVQCLCQQAREADAAEGRLEPARADEAREFGADFAPGFGGDAGGDHIARPAQEQIDQGHSPEFQKPSEYPRVRVEQHIDIGAFQPQVGQRFQRLARMDRLREEHTVDTARAGPCDDVRQDAQAQIMLRLHAAQHIAVNHFNTAYFCTAVEVRTRRPRQFPQLLGDAVHVDRKADAAIADKRDPEFFLAHKPL